MTKARAAALEALERADAPLSAAGVMAAMGRRCDQATVYRALRFLEERGLADSFALHCDEHGTERYYTARDAGSGVGHRHWFHCVSCHRFVDAGECAIGPLVGRLQEKAGLRVTGHVLYLTGTCASCSDGSAAGKDRSERA